MPTTLDGGGSSCCQRVLPTIDSFRRNLLPTSTILTRTYGQLPVCHNDEQPTGSIGEPFIESTDEDVAGGEGRDGNPVVVSQSHVT